MNHYIIVVQTQNTFPVGVWINKDGNDWFPNREIILTLYDNNMVVTKSDKAACSQFAEFRIIINLGVSQIEKGFGLK